MMLYGSVLGHGGVLIIAILRYVLRICVKIGAAIYRLLKMINWEDHRIKPVECIYTPREQYLGRELLPGQKELTGRHIKLVALWLMDEDDPYPGEWALTSLKERNKIYRGFGLSWIASGDVVELSTSQHNTAQSL